MINGANGGASGISSGNASYAFARFYNRTLKIAEYIPLWNQYFERDFINLSGLDNSTTHNYTIYITYENGTTQSTPTNTIFLGLQNVSDPCTYSSGDWNIDFADNCVITSPVNVGGNAIILTGSGTFTASGANISGFSSLRASGVAGSPKSIIYCKNGGCFVG